MHLKLFPLLCCAGPDVHYTNLFVCVFVFVCLDVSLLLSCAGTGGRFESWYGVYVCLCFFGVSWCVLMFFPSVLALMNNIKVCLCFPSPAPVWQQCINPNIRYNAIKCNAGRNTNQGRMQLTLCNNTHRYLEQ